MLGTRCKQKIAGKCEQEIVEIQQSWREGIITNKYTFPNS